MSTEAWWFVFGVLCSAPVWAMIFKHAVWQSYEQGLKDGMDLVNSLGRMRIRAMRKPVWANDNPNPPPNGPPPVVITRPPRPITPSQAAREPNAPPAPPSPR